MDPSPRNGQVSKSLPGGRFQVFVEESKNEGAKITLFRLKVECVWSILDDDELMLHSCFLERCVEFTRTVQGNGLVSGAVENQERRIVFVEVV